jgi:DnaJ-class molecular chaperone
MCGPSKTSHYRSLGLSTTASYSDIKTAYRKEIVQVHTDELVAAPAATKADGEAKSKLLNAAWACLGDKEARHLFDMQCARSTIEASRCPRPQQSSRPASDFSGFKRSHDFDSGFSGWGDSYEGPPPKRAAPKPKVFEVGAVSASTLGLASFCSFILHSR